MKKTITNIFKSMWKVFKRFPNAFAVLITGLLTNLSLVIMGSTIYSIEQEALESIDTKAIGIAILSLAGVVFLMCIITFITNIRSKQSRELLETLDAKGKHERKETKQEVKQEKAEVKKAKHSVKAEVKKEKLKDILG